jgi:competence protein ComEC
MKKQRKVVFSILAGLFCLNILAWIAVYDLSRPRFLEVIFFNLGQGDAIFIQTPEAHQILIDGGPSSAILEKLTREMPFWDRTIDLIILTHPEKDHLIGLIEVLKRYKVENILWTGVIRNTPEYKEWEVLLKKKGAKIFFAKAGQKILSQGLIMEILYPLEELAGKEFKNSNDTSIVAKLIFGGNSFLFTGDVGKNIEKELIRQYSLSNSAELATLDSDVLKVGHHGSKTSTGDEFIQQVSPEMVVISVGKGNPYGHPHQEVLEILAKYGIRVLRTDREGDIKIFSDGQKIIKK